MTSPNPPPPLSPFASLKKGEYEVRRNVYYETFKV